MSAHNTTMKITALFVVLTVTMLSGCLDEPLTSRVNNSVPGGKDVTPVVTSTVTSPATPTVTPTVTPIQVNRAGGGASYPAGYNGEKITLTVLVLNFSRPITYQANYTEVGISSLSRGKVGMGYGIKSKYALFSNCLSPGHYDIYVNNTFVVKSFKVYKDKEYLILVDNENIDISEKNKTKDNSISKYVSPNPIRQESYKDDNYSSPHSVDHLYKNWGIELDVDIGIISYNYSK